ncbi:MAG: diacylglycerol/lipid kinase family protein [Geodermatophilaceae bacterium]
MIDKHALDDALRHEQEAIVVINTRSRKAQRSFHHAVDLLEQRGVCVLSARAVDDPSALQATLRTELAAHRCRLVVIGGGDGTISEVVDCLAEHYRVLGLLPLGTSNNFARTLGIPIGIEAAVDIIATGKIADVDLGRVDGDYFANVVSAGLTVAIAARVAPWGKRHLGRLAYVIAGLRAVASQRAFQVTLSVDGAVHRLISHQVVIANGRFHAGRPIVAAASADDRLLIVQAIIARGRWRLIRSLGAYLTGRDQIPDTLVVAGSQITLDCVPPQQLEIDGELKATTPVQITIAAEALNVMVPGTFEDV